MAKNRVPTLSRIRFGWNLPGTFCRLGLHMGMFLAWMNAGLPKPEMICATSAGAIFAGCIISFDRKIIKRVGKVIRYLKPEDIYRPSKGIYQTGMYLLLAGGVFTLTAVSAGSLGWLWAVPILLLASVSGFACFRGTRTQFVAALAVLGAVVTLAAWKSSGWASAALFCLGLFLVDRLVRKALQVFFKECDAPFDNTPLRNLLLREEVPRNAFLAETELRILATDVAIPEAIIYSNHEPRMCDPEDPVLREQFVDGILGSSALPGRFPLRILRGRTPRDGEAWTDYFVNQFRKEKNNGKKFDVVFRFDYWHPLMPGHAPTHWLGDLFRCFDVMRDRATEIKMKEYEYERRHDPELPKVINIRASPRLLAQIPDLAVYNFKPGDLWRSMKIGRLILLENLPMIRHELGLDE